MSAPALAHPMIKAPGIKSPGDEAVAPAAPRLSSRSIFQGARLVVIEHEGSEYRLQITGRGKLILTR